ncbi:hypothetical protein HWV62_24073 [Athelia sp. TMB]|nr:hypothetical protein HWV62_24073 [Athelia sp. TMB]
MDALDLKSNRPHMRTRAHQAIAALDITNKVEFKKERSQLLGEGSHGQVYHGTYRHSSGKKVDRLLREVLTWKAMTTHQNIVDLLGIIVNPGGLSCLVSPLFKNNNFLRYLSTCPDEKRLALAKDIARALDQLHGNGVIHGDIKPDNILVTENGVAQITDFGIAVMPEFVGFTSTGQGARNPRYSAPELIPIVESPPIKPTRETDIFSLGILLLQVRAIALDLLGARLTRYAQIFHGEAESTPYNHIEASDNLDTQLLIRIHKGERPQKHRYNFIADNRWALIERCWRTDSASRPGIRQVRVELS